MESGQVLFEVERDQDEEPVGKSVVDFRKFTSRSAG